VEVVDGDVVVGAAVVDGDVVLGAAVVAVVAGAVLVVVVLLGGATPGAGSLNGTDALAPPSTYTGVPFVTVS
jgi:hypothetical protein